MASLSGNEPPDLRDLLAFYAAAGVDDALVDDPIDRFAENAQQRLAASRQLADRAAEAPRPGAAPATAPPQPRPAAVAAVPDEAQAAAARELASKAATLDELKQIMEGFEGCNLKATAKSMVFADGNPEADLMLVGEAPGRDEDLEGLPFVGRSGQLLDRILAAIGLDRTSAYIANVIPWRPPGNRTPTPHETEICRPFVERQIALARPKVLVTLGGPSAKLLVGSQDGILRLRGSWKNHVTADGTVIPVMPTLHPAYLLRNPAHKKLAWRDFLEVKAKLRQLGSL
ncbi:uracil-DNA glycosylase [Aminobacter sp. NyZ550]|uniref:Type-4 uracil-DNA glycosylase n=1 Tax=Aminobacter ciceronei TaxID=150723 RepID=A0ABR6CD53_9HYPH|nr:MULTISPECIES: uracil-DNA glycosylase [Aminobacter]WMC98602.1 uracil-DNA glycosylase [Aminobacter aminovorans]MBA8909202.1 DNA polymerase [Aminobacter ciceronei]MBA9022940.1 DNA polymerase [Aminobacter ciceronei]WAX94554.1 uracil-DNA glycosylase [Aminobacter sp. NyZ550]BBD36899.1 DNA polymerase [Aminobacter sp. SS-2016]